MDTIEAAPPKRSPGPAAMTSAAFRTAFWITMRPYLLFISGAAGLAGMAFTPDPSPGRLLAGFPPLLFAYGLGQALTDCFQTDTDALSSPYRPLIKGTVSRRQVMSASLTGLGASVAILAALNPEILVLGLGAVAGLLSYTFFKRRWWGGPFWNSWIVALLPLMGRMTGGDVGLRALIPGDGPGHPAFMFMVAAIFFGYANFVVMGYLKDISADRATGYRTFPVVFGWRATVLCSDSLALLAAAGTGAAVFSDPRPPLIATTVFAASVLVAVLSQARIHRIRDERRAHGPIAGTVRAFILSCSAVTLALEPGWAVFLAAFYLAFEAALHRRPEPGQV